MKYKLIIFDMDGTILDTLQDLANAINYALQKTGFEAKTIDQVRQFVGNGIEKLIERATPLKATENQKESISKYFFEFYDKHCSDCTKPYPGIIELLQKLKQTDTILCVNSNKIDYAVKNLCDKYFKGLFDITFGSRKGIKNKPAPDSVFEILSQAKIDKKDALYIGDSDVDIQTAINADIASIGVDWGFRGEDFLKSHGAKITVKNTAELEKFLEL